MTDKQPLKLTPIPSPKTGGEKFQHRGEMRAAVCEVSQEAARDKWAQETLKKIVEETK